MIDIEKLRAEYSQRFGYAISMANHDDYYSLDGKTWDPSADWSRDVKYIFGSDDFRAFIFSEIDKITQSSNPPTIDKIEPELRAWLLRIEMRD